MRQHDVDGLVFASPSIGPVTFDKTDLVYLSGPMSGVQNLNRKLFTDIQAWLVAKFGCKVFNPATAFQADDLPYHDYIRPDLHELTRPSTTAIMMLPNWWRSKGARIEFDVAVMSGIKMCDAYLHPILP